MIAPAQIQARLRALPPLSQSAVRLQALARDPRSSAADFERVIRPDPALTANLLRIVNSAHFGLRRRVETVRQAVSMLGVRRVTEVAVGAALGPVIPARLPGYEVDAATFWIHSAGVAVLAERLAGAVGRSAPDLTFTAALLHDLGKLAACAFVAGDAVAIRARLKAGEGLEAAERAVLGHDHGELGAMLAEGWSLPAAVGSVARWHHRPGGAPEADRTLVALVHAADALAHALGIGADVGELAREIDPAALAALGVNVRRLERVASESLDAIREMGALFAPPGGER